MSEHDDRRRATRYALRAHADLDVEGSAHEAYVLNISRRGVLVAVLAEHTITAGQRLTIDIAIDELAFQLSGKVAHVKSHYLGLACEPAKSEDQAQMDTLMDRMPG